ncbi:TonB-dependent receptor [Xanthovirga aplysinae]|uniref:TonB-dependent receptor n=1 Tax=Xanthovirga aplysinae TaxID=2529853 RepID=UPI0012BCAAFF|nr:TonB-dependent receptor [Xanthovirga aplysinae]MTI32969.1 TonB-dependent receptor [Xanthovirga aplysinae]
MKNLERVGSLLLLCFLQVSTAFAQQLTQTIRGQIIDQDTRLPLVGANVIVLDSEPFLGSTTDLEGNFRLENVLLGRVNLKVTYMGYEERLVPNILLSSSKETILTVGLVESIVKMESIEVKANSQKAEVLNEMASVSARTFSVEETKRFAGSFNDPARMVSAFAGVSGSPEGDNDIIVRGNSSRGILWRLEGIEIPNPNHFSSEGSTGGPINALNSKMLSNSDFFTGAFAPEYGNALSGVFDMQLRKGNNEQREYSLGVGVLGTDVTLEGPIKKGSGASYLLNYRYSSLALLDKLNILDFGGIPLYQDASFKVYVPTRKLGIFDLFGLGGLSSISQDNTDNGNSLLGTGKSNSKLGVVGLKHFYSINNNTYLHSSVSLAGNSNGEDYQEYILGKVQPVFDQDLSNISAKFSTALNKKFNAQNKLETGFIYTQMNYNFQSGFFDLDEEQYVNGVNEKGNAALLQFYSSWKHRLNEQLTFVSGLHYMHFLLNNSYSIEPRLGVSWAFKAGQSLNAGFGVHSKLENLVNYFGKVRNADGSFATPNRDMSMTRAFHYVIGYQNQINENLNFNAEVYYQQLVDVPVENDPNSSFSLINSMGGYYALDFVNEGSGRNYGLELTLERFYANNFFYLFTASLYDSRYTAMDGVERESRFNGKYGGNFLFGKEFRLGSSEKNRSLGLNLKIALAGGKFFTPVDLESSKAAGYGVYVEEKLSAQGDDVFTVNLGLTYRRERTKVSHMIKLDIQNLTNNKAVVGEYYNPISEEIMEYNQLSLVPELSYTLSF